MKKEDQTEMVMMMTLVMLGTTEQEGRGEQCMSSAILNVSVVHPTTCICLRRGGASG